MHRMLVLFLALLAVTNSLAQSSQPGRTLGANKTSLAKSVDWGVFAARLFSDSNKVGFRLATSWVPGENHKGMLRYKLLAFSVPPDEQSNKDADCSERAEQHLPCRNEKAEIENLMKRVHACDITLNLYDTQGFVLRKILISFNLGVDDQAIVNSLTANDGVQMDSHEYLDFVGDSKTGGSWSVSWACSP